MRAEDVGSGVLINAAESEAFVAFERFQLLSAIDAYDPASMRMFYHYDRTQWSGTITLWRVLTYILEFHPILIILTSRILCKWKKVRAYCIKHERKGID